MFRQALLGAALCLLTFEVAGQRAGLRDSVAGIPVNYQEENVGEYDLPDPLTFSSGMKVSTPGEWYSRRRPEILSEFREFEYGFAPPRPDSMKFDLFDTGSDALAGSAVRKQVRIYFTGDTAGPKMDLLIYIPSGQKGPFPLLLSINFIPNSTYIDDSGIRRGMMWNREHVRVPAPRESRFGNFDPRSVLSKGIAFASVYYGDIEPDFKEGIKLGGIRREYLEPGDTLPAADGWGAIAAWAWGLSRAMDYLETDPDIQSDKVAITGISRLGKTVLWAGANDPRFAMVIASCSGEGGAALSRRNYGETIAHLTAPSRYPYQFCRNYAKFADDVRHFPVDSHMLIALIAPRPLLLQTGTTDYWSDPKGEFLAAVAAGPVYELLGAKGLGVTEMPDPGQPILHTLGYFEHEGGHGTLPSDLDVFLDFMQLHLLAPAK